MRGSEFSKGRSPQPWDHRLVADQAAQQEVSGPQGKGVKFPSSVFAALASQLQF